MILQRTIHQLNSQQPTTNSQLDVECWILSLEPIDSNLPLAFLIVFQLYTILYTEDLLTESESESESESECNVSAQCSTRITVLSSYVWRYIMKISFGGEIEN